MSQAIVVFHGSAVVVEKPKVIIKQAKRWALVKRPGHVINKYSYHEDSQLKILKFEKMTDEWLDFVVACRRGIAHQYDMVEGPMADDTIWDYIEDYIEGEITREAFWVLVKFKYPTHQIVFCNDKALETLKFEGSYAL